MNGDQIGELVRLLREAAGETQNVAAQRCGLSQSRLSKIEKGLYEPTQQDLKEFARAYSVPLAYFRQHERVRGPGVGFEMHYRKQASTGKKLLRQVEARMELFRLGFARLVDGVEIEADFELPEVDVDESSPEDIARTVRVGWHVPSGPIRQLAPILEAAGIVSIPFHFGSPRIDAVSLASPRIPPLIFFSPSAPGCRQRMSFAHELGHILMHRFPTETMEDEANAFAAAFLLPEREFVRDLKGLRVLRIEHLAALKEHWHVSMAAIARRAYKLRLICDWNYKTLNIEMSTRGWRKVEPVEVAREHPTLCASIIEAHLEDDMSIEDVSAFTFLPTDVIEYQASPDQPRLRRVK